MAGEEMRACTRCWLEWDESEFYIRKDGHLRSWCKQCTKDHDRSVKLQLPALWPPTILWWLTPLERYSPIEFEQGCSILEHQRILKARAIIFDRRYTVDEDDEQSS